MDTCSINHDLTRQIREDIEAVLSTTDEYTAVKYITSRYLGARRSGENQAQIGFWVPGLVNGAIHNPGHQIRLEIFMCNQHFDISSLEKNRSVKLEFDVQRLPLMAAGDYLIGVIDNVMLGDRNRLGALYWLSFETEKEKHVIRDPLVQSCPFGIYAPAELFDMQTMLQQRRDHEYFTRHYKSRLADGGYRARDIGTHLEIHPETATQAGTIESLTAKFKHIASKIQSNIDSSESDLYRNLTADERNFVGFDTIELTPEVPTSEREAETGFSGEFFRIEDSGASGVCVMIKRPDISNWGYDTPILGSAAISPSILGSLRPNEFLDFIETLHTMPDRPIQLCLDSVLGHCDFQGARLLQTFDKQCCHRDNLKYVNSKYLRGPNMYGRDIDFANPNVKAILLELLIRKINLGYDCVRVDGAQDFIQHVNEETGLRVQDDVFLNEMANVVQDINGIKRRLDFNFEDGRPWPDDLNWLYNSKYLDHCIERSLPDNDRVKQWSPIIFAHNVHGKYKWFMEKWDRFVEVFRYGENWITGHSNHDNARYFYRLVATTPSSRYVPGDAFSNYYNDQLGGSLTEVAHRAMDNNALTTLSLGFLPGNPMFLLNALYRSPWGFIRDIDDRYDVKIVADEGSRCFTWYVDALLYDQPQHFKRLKALGFVTYSQLVSGPELSTRRPAFLDALYNLVSKVKTDALMARHLFDDVEDAGGYADILALIDRLDSLRQSDLQRLNLLQSRIDKDPIESDRRVIAAQKLMRKTLRFVRRDFKTPGDSDKISLKHQIEKLDYLLSLDDNSLALLIEDADEQSEYNLTKWIHDAALINATPESMQDNSLPSVKILKSFARDFMLDLRDAAKIHHYAQQVDDKQSGFNLKLRKFRQNNPWLLHNPTNDVRLDYFSRKLYINGAKDTGDWGDKGDVVKCNTVYYGWRTSHDAGRQVFIIANMEGRTIERCPLDLFLNLPGEWQVAAHSPTLENIPDRLDRSFVIENFCNGQALLLERVC